MKAISIRPAWAWLIIRPDLVTQEARAAALNAGLFKDIENRTWSTNVRGRVLVHASQGNIDAHRAATEFAKTLGVTVPSRDGLQRGGIIGSVEIAGCVTKSDSPWFFGPKGFVLRNPQPMPFSPLRGRLGFFDAEVTA